MGDKIIGAGDDPTNPNYYKQGGMEVIDIIEKFGLGFHVGNALKYILRAGSKTASVELDLGKALWYIRRAIEFKI